MNYDRWIRVLIGIINHFSIVDFIHCYLKLVFVWLPLISLLQHLLARDVPTPKLYPNPQTQMFRVGFGISISPVLPLRNTFRLNIKQNCINAILNIFWYINYCMSF
jgi:hypothetical protein